MTKELKNKILESIRISTLTCIDFVNLAEKDERNDDILRDLEYVRYWANSIVQKIDFLKQCRDEDNKQNEKQEDVIS